MRFAVALWLVVCPLCSQFETKLEPATAAAFESYVKSVEQELNARWSGREPFLSLNVAPEDAKKLLAGDLLIRPATSPNPRSIPDGLIHDWVGALYIPDTSMERVLAVLQDFDRHSQIYPEIVRSRLISRQGDDIIGYWRLERKQQFVPAVFDVRDEAHYKQIGPGRWICRAYANDIREVEDAGSSKETVNPPGEALGLLWRLNAFWSLEVSGNGVLAECRTISLSRSIPGGMGWIIKPFIQNVPRESLASTLQNTRKILRRAS
jgi:hypothetical protein